MSTQTRTDREELHKASAARHAGGRGCAGLGFPGSLTLEADAARPALAARGACAALEALLAQRTRDAAAAAAAAERLADAHSQAAVAAGARDRLAARLDARERALGALENQARQTGICIVGTLQVLYYMRTSA